MEAAAAQRMAALDAVFQGMLDDRFEGRGYRDLPMNELVDQAFALVDEIEPEPESVTARRLNVMSEAAKLYLAGDDSDREMLESDVGRSGPLVWATKEYLKVTPSNPGDVARLFAAAAMVAGSEDNRDLLVRLVEVIGEAAERGVPTTMAADQVESLAGAPWAALLRRIRERDPDEW